MVRTSATVSDPDRMFVLANHSTICATKRMVFQETDADEFLIKHSIFESYFLHFLVGMAFPQECPPLSKRQCDIAFFDIVYNEHQGLLFLFATAFLIATSPVIDV